MPALNDRAFKVLTDSTHIADAMSKCVVDSINADNTPQRAATNQTATMTIVQELPLSELAMEKLSDLLQQSFETECLDTVYSYDGITYCEATCWTTF